MGTSVARHTAPGPRIALTSGVPYGRWGLPRIRRAEGLPLAEPRAAIFEFPTIEAVRGFWNDPGYQEVVELRRQLGTFQIFMLAGRDESLSEGGGQAIEAQQR